MHGSTEGAWVNMMVAGAGQGFDAANAPGKWRDNPVFKHLHTQNPRSNMDDRFDILFFSNELTLPSSNSVKFLNNFCRHLFTLKIRRDFLAQNFIFIRKTP